MPYSINNGIWSACPITKGTVESTTGTTPLGPTSDMNAFVLVSNFITFFPISEIPMEMNTASGLITNITRSAIMNPNMI